MRRLGHEQRMNFKEEDRGVYITSTFLRFRHAIFIRVFRSGKQNCSVFITKRSRHVYNDKYLSVLKSVQSGNISRVASISALTPICMIIPSYPSRKIQSADQSWSRLANTEGIQRYAACWLIII